MKKLMKFLKKLGIFVVFCGLCYGVYWFIFEFETTGGKIRRCTKTVEQSWTSFQECKKNGENGEAFLQECMNSKLEMDKLRAEMDSLGDADVVKTIDESFFTVWNKYGEDIEDEL